MFNPLMGEELARLLDQERQESLFRQQRRAADLAALALPHESAVRQRLGFAVVRVGERIAGAEARPTTAKLLP